MWRQAEDQKAQPTQEEQAEPEDNSCLNVVRIGSELQKLYYYPYLLPAIEVHHGLIVAFAGTRGLEIANLRNARPIVIYDPDIPIAGLGGSGIDDVAVKAC